MAYRITEECTACGLCESECPVQAISVGDPVYLIDPEKCVECKGHYESPRCAEVCPLGACVPA